jgi:clan AA aspartic protease (TIGR02281 family)
MSSNALEPVKGATCGRTRLFIALPLLIAVLVALRPEAVRADSVPLKRENGAYVVRAMVNDQITLNFTLDSGAADVSIPADVFSTLVRTGTIAKTDYLDTQVYQLADGSESRAQRVRLRSLRVGNVEIRDVIASVAPQAGTLLLGQSFLARLGSWSIDNQQHLLVINESRPGGATGEPIAPPTTQRNDGYAPDWMLVGRDDTTSLYVDKNSLQTTNGIHRAWEKIVYVPHTHALMDKWQGVQLVLNAVNCEANIERMEYMAIFFEDGSDQRTPEERRDRPWHSVAPGSIGDEFQKYVCNH